MSDAIAGVTVGLTVIPQGEHIEVRPVPAIVTSLTSGIAYALIAGLPPQYGLYSAFMGCFVYIFFGSSKDITIGPTAIMALMTGQHAQLGADYAVLLAFISGLIILLCGLLRLGFLIDFISVPVIAGFTSAAAITIASSQVKSLLGLTILEHSHLHHLGIIPKWIDVFTNIQTCRWQDASLGLITCVVLLTLRSLNRTDWLKEAEEGEEVRGCRALCNKLPRPALRFLAKFVWFVCTARNAIVVILCLGLAMVVDKDTFTLTSEIDSGLPAFQPPPFSVTANTTESDYSSSHSDTEITHFGEMLSNLGAAVIIIPMIAILESVAIAKAFGNWKL